MSAAPLGKHDLNETIRYLSPAAAKLFFEETGSYGQIWYRWRRFLLRMMARRVWHDQSLLLWLQSRSYLHYLPFPYPSIETPEQWQVQAHAQFQAGTILGKHYHIAEYKNLFTSRNLQELSQFRNRVGWRLAFAEDPVLDGLMAARSHRGQASRLKQAAIQEIKKQADKDAEKAGRVVALRELIGPRGGLPTLKSDLIKLAHLLDVEIGEKDTIPIIKSKVQPIVQDLAMAYPANAASSQPAPKPVAQPRTPSLSVAQPKTPGSGSLTSTPSPAAPAEANQQLHDRHLEDQLQFVESRVTAMVENRVGHFLSDSENRMQAMLSQVMQHVMGMSNPPMNGAATQETTDAEMVAPFPPEMPR